MANNSTSIRSFRNEYAFLSNMFECPVTFDGITFRCAEAAFQAQKTFDEDVRMRFAQLDGPSAKREGRKVELRKDWELELEDGEKHVKLGIMRSLLRAKFTQNPELGAKLIATGDAELVEGNTWGDTFWGVDSRRGGQNHLGKLLMDTRTELKSQLGAEVDKNTDGSTSQKGQTTVKNIISTLITDKKLIADKAVKVADLTIFQSAENHNIYVYNAATKRAYVYSQLGANGKPLSLVKYKTQCDALKARVKAEAAKAERERITQWKREHNEAQNGVKPSVVDNSAVNAPATKNAVLLDAEREDSGFDYRQGEDILSQSEADTYEEVGSDLLVEDKTDLTGFHRGVLTAWQSVKGRVITLKDGSRKTYSPYIALTFNVDGTEFTSRAYAPQWNSFKIQANYNHRKLFTYMKDSVALDTLVGQTFDLWIKFNELLSKDGEFQAEFYDREGYAMKKRQQNIDAGAIRSNGYSRIVEERATR